jgi:hypothetical protein
MHKKLGPKGLHVMSVSVTENAPNEAIQERTLTFLKKQEAKFPNLILDASFDFWGDKFTANRPFLYVFNRAGQWRRFDANDLDEQNADTRIEALILEWLKEK